MVDVEYLERKKTELVVDHVKRCGVAPLSEAEKIVLVDLDFQIKQLREMQDAGKERS